MVVLPQDIVVVFIVVVLPEFGVAMREVGLVALLVSVAAPNILF